MKHEMIFYLIIVAVLAMGIGIMTTGEAQKRVIPDRPFNIIIPQNISQVSVVQNITNNITQNVTVNVSTADDVSAGTFGANQGFGNYVFNYSTVVYGFSCLT